MLHPKIGSVWSWKPDAFDSTKKEGIPRIVRGTVIYVNEAHRCFTAEAIVNGATIRETFKF